MTGVRDYYPDNEFPFALPLEEWLTVADIATALRVSERRVKHWIANGELVAVQPLGESGVRIHRLALEAFCDVRSTRPNPNQRPRQCPNCGKWHKPENNQGCPRYCSGRCYVAFNGRKERQRKKTEEAQFQLTRLLEKLKGNSE